MEKIKIGTIVNVVALRGEVKVYNYSDSRERYELLDRIFVGDVPYAIEHVRYQQQMVILKLAGVNDRTAAEKLKGKDVFITEDDLRELPEDTYYIRDLIGLPVIDGRRDTQIGTLKDVLQNGAQDVYVVALADGGEAMIPAVAQFIKDVDLGNEAESGWIKVEPIPGMLES